MSRRRVGVSGVGVVSALGLDRHAHWDALAAGRAGIGPLRLERAADLSFSAGAQVQGWDPARWFDQRALLLLDPFAQYLIVAAREAMADAGLEPADPRLAERTALITGTGLGGQQTEDDGYLEVYGRGRPRVHPFTIPRAMHSAGVSQLAMAIGAGGPAFTLATACASSAHAIGLAAWLVRHGMADLALAGGSEAPFCWGHLNSWEALRVMAPDTCRPFSIRRRGMVLGEGAAMLVIEPIDAARARGAAVYAELAGVGLTSDAGHITQPAVDGVARAMRLALEDGGLAPERVDYVNAHGSGTPANDPVETRAIRQALGRQADRALVSSTKSMHGHMLGAAGAVEAACVVFAMRTGTVPPTANYLGPDPECDLDVVPNQARPHTIDVALSNSLAFGGLNAVLAFARAEA